MRRIIRWEHWKSPLGPGPEYVPEDEMEFDPESPPPHQGESARPVIPTPDGFMPVFIYKQNAFFENFRFWMMHTNFPITEDMQEALDFHDGVELLDIVTKYRVRIGIGKCFDPEKVKLSIEELLEAQRPSKKESITQMKLDDEMVEKVETLKRMAAENYNYWMIYVVPNGELVLARTDEGQHYENYLDLLRQTQELAGGTLIVSHE